MDHVDTTDSPYNVQNKSSMTVFLGMKITTNADGIWTSVQPKGVGWKWISQRFIEYGACHTHYTKWYMLKGLLIRALTIFLWLQACVHVCFYPPKFFLWVSMSSEVK